MGYSLFLLLLIAFIVFVSYMVYKYYEITGIWKRGEAIYDGIKGNSNKIAELISDIQENGIDVNNKFTYPSDYLIAIYKLLINEKTILSQKHEIVKILSEIGFNHRAQNIIDIQLFPYYNEVLFSDEENDFEFKKDIIYLIATKSAYFGNRSRSAKLLKDYAIHRYDKFKDSNDPLVAFAVMGLENASKSNETAKEAIYDLMLLRNTNEFQNIKLRNFK